MKTYFLEKETLYDGSQLCSHFILKETGLYGDACAAFIGPARVDLSHMVDLEDVLAKKAIYSEKMLHFLIEYFDVDLERMILRQRLFVSLMGQQLMVKKPGLNVLRTGDDLFSEGKKLTVSIATASPVSCLIHTGINISSRNTPVPTLGLADLSIDPRDFALTVMNAYTDEQEGVSRARVKVRPVP